MPNFLNCRQKVIAKIETTPNGGYIRRWVVNGKEILFPDQEVEINGEKKRRGGMPILFPWADQLSDKPAYPRHGFARDSLWQIKTETPEKIEYYLSQKSEFYPYNYQLDLEIEINDNFLTHKLVLHNFETKPIPVALGIHPYFNNPLADLSKIMINIPDLDLTNYKLGKTLIFPVSSGIKIKIPGLGTIMMSISGYRYLAVWTDNPKYICFEPWSVTLDGFLKKDQQILVPPGQKAEFVANFQVFPS